MDEMHGYGKGFWETRLKKWFKQLFCRHVYVNVGGEKLLRKVRETTGIVNYAAYYANFSYFTQKRECLLCEKEVLVEIGRQHLSHFT